MECPCGEEIDDSAMKYSYRKEVDPIRCDGCLDIIFGKKWRNEAIVDQIEKSMDQSKAMIIVMSPDEAAQISRETLNHMIRRVKPFNRSPAIQTIPMKRFRDKPDPNCPKCKMARKFGTVEKCECMKI